MYVQYIYVLPLPLPLPPQHFRTQQRSRITKKRIPAAADIPIIRFLVFEGSSPPPGSSSSSGTSENLVYHI